MQPSTTFDNIISSNKLTQFNQSSSLSSSPPVTSDLHRHIPSANTNNITAMASNSLHSAQTPSAMGPPAHPASMASSSKKYLDISSLMSPPDQVIDSFSHTYHNYDAGKAVSYENDSEKHPMPMSPPISPYSKAMATTETPITPSSSIKDPVLYPSDETPSSPTQAPLFAPAEIDSHKRIIDEHLQARENNAFVVVSPPKRGDYELVLSFKSQIINKYKQNPQKWLEQERRQLKADQRARDKGVPRILAAKPAKTPRVRADRVQKPQPTPRPIRAHPAASPNRPAARVSVSGTPEPSRRVVAPNREDKDFNAQEDFCPPLDTLPSKPNCLKVDWKGQPVNLSNDPHVNLLHPEEVALASTLRLDCATYLTSKRRIFTKRLQCYQIGKEFRKTDAQQACKIDVNKASKLWAAFDKVNWLDSKWMEPFKQHQF
ncbi:Homeodomain-like protein [Fusarium austroafricanum]|uniref:Homeodomain-like protein n=1 Tax=Fusarium austroafricanum TaxID=2364996 RepID=A0A8H4KLR4_9HYPO|nr:Homeodomain-like protein [Fusarium austroafricanum]